MTALAIWILLSLVTGIVVGQVIKRGEHRLDAPEPIDGAELLKGLRRSGYEGKHPAERDQT